MKFTCIHAFCVQYTKPNIDERLGCSEKMKVMRSKSVGAERLWTDTNTPPELFQNFTRSYWSTTTTL